jgi:Putative transmembrane protein (PGPGW)
MPRTVRRIVIFATGLLLILIGLVLVVLPGPLTIPPIILGVWLWSLEFEFARHWIAPLRRRGSQALDAAREKPVHTTVVTVLGLVGAGLVIVAVLHYDLLGRAADVIGLG